MWQYNYNDELMHSGIMGMKWGHRKAQSSTSSGRTASKRSVSSDAQEAEALKKKNTSELSNAELKKLNERQNLEQNHARLNPSHVKKGVAFVAAAAATMNTALNLYNNSDKIIALGKKHLGKLKG